MFENIHFDFFNGFKQEKSIIDSPFELSFESSEIFRIHFLKGEIEADNFLFKTDPSNLERKNEFPFNPIIKEERSTAIRTNNNRYLPKKLIKKEDNYDKFYPFEQIEKILKNSNCSQNILSHFKRDSRIEEGEKNLKLLQKKRKRRSKRNDSDKKNIFENITKYNMGRKNLKDKSERKHDKFSPDNIIKKIKAKMFEFLIIFVNNLITNNIKLKDLNYSIIDRLKKETDLEILGTPIKDLLSNDISPKYSQYAHDFNKKLIDSLLEKEKNNEALMFIFDITFRDWVELYTMKKNVKDWQNLTEESCRKIEEHLNNMNELEKVLKDNNNNSDYFSNFIFYLFNYERWFSIRRNRKRNKKQLN